MFMNLKAYMNMIYNLHIFMDFHGFCTSFSMEKMGLAPLINPDPRSPTKMASQRNSSSGVFNMSFLQSAAQKPKEKWEKCGKYRGKHQIHQQFGKLL